VERNFPCGQRWPCHFESNGKVYDVNEAAANHFGYTKEEMLAPDFSLEDLIVDANRAFQAFEEAILSGSAIGLEFAHRHKNGSIVFAKVSFENYLDNRIGSMIAFWPALQIFPT